LLILAPEKKYLFIQYYNNEGIGSPDSPVLDKFDKFVIFNDVEYNINLDRARGLKLISDISETPTIVTSLGDIIPGETYEKKGLYIETINKKVPWPKVEYKAIEDEMLLAVTDFVDKIEMYKLPVEIFPTRTMYKNKKPIMEWDKIIVCDNKVFLLESKPIMTKVCIKELLSIMNSCRLLIT